ncbi:hypothetical protein ACFQY1_00790 [Flavobacterium sp. GCM10027622]
MTHFLNSLLQNDIPIDEEFNLFLFAMLLLGIAFICICVIAAIVVTVLVLVLLFCGITLGAISTSVLVGIHQKSVTAGFRTFMMVFSTFSFAVIGMVAFWLLNQITHWWSTTKAIIVGLTTGLIGGLIIGIVLAIVIQKVATLLKNKLLEKNNPNG